MVRQGSPRTDNGAGDSRIHALAGRRELAVRHIEAALRDQRAPVCERHRERSGASHKLADVANDAVRRDLGGWRQAVPSGVD